MVAHLLLQSSGVYSDCLSGSRYDMELCMANYALLQAGNVPPGFMCTLKGQANLGCHCWTPTTNRC